jgi:hypothetical protein
MAGSSGLSLKQGFEDYPWNFHFSFQMYVIIVYYIQMSNRLCEYLVLWSTALGLM